MDTTIYALYSFAKSETQQERWLFDHDAEEAYRDSVRFAESQRVELLRTLRGRSRALFETYTDNLAEARALEGQMFFAQRLAMGLRLGGLGQ